MLCLRGRLSKLFNQDANITIGSTQATLHQDDIRSHLNHSFFKPAPI
jgi:hypothetical protein